MLRMRPNGLELRQKDGGQVICEQTFQSVGKSKLICPNGSLCDKKLFCKS